MSTTTTVYRGAVLNGDCCILCWLSMVCCAASGYQADVIRCSGCGCSRSRSVCSSVCCTTIDGDVWPRRSIQPASTTSEPLRGPPLKGGPVLVGFTQLLSSVHRGLELSLSRIPEATAHTYKVLLLRFASIDGHSSRFEPIEGVMLEGTLPQMLTRPHSIEAKHEGVLLLAALVVVLNYNQRELFALKIEPSDFRPKEEANLG